MEKQKKAVTEYAVSLVPEGAVIGIGSGSTVNYFIEALSQIKHSIEGAVCASENSQAQVKAMGIPIVDLNSVSELEMYFDGADEINPLKQMIKGGGGAHTREKIIAAVARQFICMVDPSKLVNALGQFPIAVEVLALARSYVARHLYRLGARVEYRQGFVTDEGNVILDVWGLDLSEPMQLESNLNNIEGLVAHGLFAKRRADKVLSIGQDGGVITIL